MYNDNSYSSYGKRKKSTCSHCKGTGNCGGGGYSCATCRAAVEERTGEHLVPASSVMCTSCNGRGYHFDDEY